MQVKRGFGDARLADSNEIALRRALSFEIWRARQDSNL
jgi:hypothetical protein